MRLEDRLLRSMQQAVEIAKGTRAPARQYTVQEVDDVDLLTEWENVNTMRCC